MTISIKIKEHMANMPDTLNTKKEIDDYYKDAMAKVLKDNKKNNENKPKKELNGYQQFMKDNIKSVKEGNPKLTGSEVFSIIAAMWKKQKEADGVKADDVKEADDVNEEDDVKVKDEKEVGKEVEEDVKVKEEKDVGKEGKKKEKEKKVK